MTAHILKILSGAENDGMLVAYLRTELGIRFQRTPGAAEYQEALNELKADGYIEDAGASFSKDPRVKITPAGRKAARKL